MPRRSARAGRPGSTGHKRPAMTALCRLRRLAAPAEPRLAHPGQPGQAPPLVGPQRRGEPGRRLDVHQGGRQPADRGREVGERVVATGEFTGTEIMRVADLNIMEAQVNVNENDVPEVKVGDKAVISIEHFWFNIVKLPAAA